jgi:hypothetical protein
MKKKFRYGDVVSWYSKRRKRVMTGTIEGFVGTTHAYIIVRTWDGRGHHWIEPKRILRKVKLD